MNPGEFKVVVKVEGVKIEGTPVSKEFELGPINERIASEALTGIANLFDALVSD